MPAETSFESPPMVSIVILNYNGRDLLRPCLESVLESDYPRFEVLLVDNGSTDDSVQSVRDLVDKDSRIKLILNGSNLGFAEGNNVAIKHVKGEYVVILNNDTEVRRDWLNHLVEVMEQDHTIGIAQSKLLLMKDRKRLDSAGAYLTNFGFLFQRGLGELDYGQYDATDEIFSAKAASIIIRKDLIDRVGLFDPEYFLYLEETDLCFRTWLIGLRVVFAPRSVVYHYWGAITVPKVGREIPFYSCRNYAMTLIKNLEFGNLLRIMPIHTLLWVFLAIRFIVQGRIQRAKTIGRALIWIFKALPKIWAKRERVQHLTRKVSDKDLMPRVMRKPNPAYFYRFMKTYL